MTPTLEVLLLWLGFAGSHMLLSSPGIRGPLVARIGEQPFRGLYSLVAFGFFIPLVSIYFANKHAGPLLWSLPRGPALLIVMWVGMAAAFVLVTAALVDPGPAFVVAGAATPRGVYRIARHPLLMGLGLFALLHLLPNGSASDVAFFGGFAVFSVVGAHHQDLRKLGEGRPEFAAFHAATPFLPFTGRDTWRGLREFSLAALAIGIALTVVVRHFHPTLFGG
jgi:uncharacterized membrane protein